MTSILISAVLCLLIQSVASQVDTDLGVINGIQGTGFSEYRGIPYAEPPIRDLRFARPVPISSFGDDPLDATQFQARCPKSTLTADQLAEASEDCLFLNVVVPNVTLTNPFPVLVFIPGQGAGSDYVGQDLAVVGNVIVVTTNYRDESLGFFSTGDDCMPGNYGLWDQRLAIEWVRDNIDAFGGDGSSITIVGQGMGALGVSAQLLSPLNNNQVFQRAIAQSGVLDDNRHFVDDEEAENLAIALAESLDCNNATWLARLVCLRNKTWQEIVSSSQTPGFMARIDGHFLPIPVDELLQRDDIYQYDVIIGFNSDEALGLVDNPDLPDLTSSDQLRQAVVDLYTEMYYDEETAALAYGAIELSYVDPVTGITNADSALRLFLDISADSSVVSNSVTYLRSHQESQDANTYMYYFDYQDMDYSVVTTDLRSGAASGEELFYLWDSVLGQDGTGTSSNSDTTSIRGAMIQYWTNFVATGDPNSAGTAVTWPTYNSTDEQYLVVESPIAVAQNYEPRFTELWLGYIPELFADSDICIAEAPAPDFLTQTNEDEVIEYLEVNVTDPEGTELGQVRGTVRTADQAVGGRRIANFRGIPYAIPPLGERRFTNAELLDDWGENIFLNATEEPPACLQGGFPAPGTVPSSYREDCLFLNIYAPASEADADPVPVIVYLHSGQLTSGTSVSLDATQLASYSNAIVVMVSYRVGALGWLSTGDDECPGNFGLTDALTSLQWVNYYIGNFGGDANNVTVFGMGSGSTLGFLMLINRLADGLIHKLIALGDSVISPITLIGAAVDPLPLAQELAVNLSCPTTPTSDLINCLREKTGAEISGASFGESSNFIQNVNPAWDGKLLKDSSDKLLKSGDFPDIPMLLGATESDNTIITAVYLLATGRGCPTEEQALSIIDDLVATFYDGREEMASMLNMFYLQNDVSPTIEYENCRIGYQLSEMLSDIWLIAPFIETGDIFAQLDRNFYLYFLRFQARDNLYDFILPSWADISFGDDVPLAFGWPFDQDKIQSSGICFSVDDRVVSLNFMEMISSFARDGVPQVPLTGDAKWQPFTPDTHNALYLDVCSTQEAVPRGVEKQLFWYEVLAVLNNRTVDEPMDPPTMTSPTDGDTVYSFIGLEVSAERAGDIIGGLIIGYILLCVLVIAALLLCLCCRNSEGNKPV